MRRSFFLAGRSRHSRQQFVPRAIQRGLQPAEDRERRVRALASFQFLQVAPAHPGPFRHLLLREPPLLPQAKNVPAEQNTTGGRNVLDGHRRPMFPRRPSSEHEPFLVFSLAWMRAVGYKSGNGPATALHRTINGGITAYRRRTRRPAST